MIMAPGDLILDDEDGLLIIPFRHINAIYTATQDKQDLETKIMVDIEADTLDQSWVGARLKALGCIGL